MKDLLVIHITDDSNLYRGETCDLCKCYLLLKDDELTDDCKNAIIKLIDSEFTSDSYYQTFKASIINQVNFAISYDKLVKISYVNFPKFEYCNIDFSIVAIDEV